MLRPAVPPAVVELLADKPGDHAVDILAEVGAEPNGHAVDAGLDLAAEIGLPALLPTAVVPHQRHGPAHLVTRRVDAEVTQLQEAVRGGGPGLAPVVGRVMPAGFCLAVRSPPWRPTSGPPSRAGKYAPPAHWPSSPRRRQQPGAPPLGGHPCTLCGDDVGRCAGKIPQRLPSNGGIRIQQPVQYGHAPIVVPAAVPSQGAVPPPLQRVSQRSSLRSQRSRAWPFFSRAIWERCRTRKQE